MKNKQKILATVALKVFDWHRGRIEHLKKNAKDLDRDDFIWHYLLQSFATMGRSAGWRGLIGTPENYNELHYEKLMILKKGERLRHVKKICKRSKIRMPDKKAEYICACFIKIENAGGYKKVKQELLALKGRDEKMKFLRTFSGIGEKYARNIMMDVYHPDFRDSIAVDARIKNILQKLKVDLPTYLEQEKFLVEAAKLVSMNGWELDRVMYGYWDEFLTELDLKIRI